MFYTQLQRQNLPAMENEVPTIFDITSNGNLLVSRNINITMARIVAVAAAASKAPVESKHVATSAPLSIRSFIKVCAFVVPDSRPDQVTFQSSLWEIRLARLVSALHLLSSCSEPSNANKPFSQSVLFPLLGKPANSTQASIGPMLCTDIQDIFE